MKGRKVSDIVKDVEIIRVINQEKRRSLKVFEEKLIFSYGQGIFRADQQTISFTKLLSEYGKGPVILLDVNNIPIEIDDVDDFIQEAIFTFNHAINKLKSDYEEIQGKRNKEAFYE